MTEPSEGTFQFDEDFEQKLLAFLVRDIKFFLRSYLVIQEKYFENRIRGEIFAITKSYVEKYNQSMPQEDARNLITEMFIRQKKKDITIDTYFELLADLYTRDLSGEKYAEDLVLSFAQNKEMQRVLMDGGKRVLARRDLKPILTGVTKALSIGNKLELGYDYFNETVERTSRNYEVKSNVVSTGFKRLDNYLGGGLAGGDMGIIVGPSSRGKTAVLVNLAVGAMMRRKNVVYITLEGRQNPAEDIGVRLDMRISRINRDLLLKESVKVRDCILYFYQIMRAKIILKSFPTETVTVDDIDRYITQEEIVSGFKPDLIIIDYLNLCKRSNPREDTWLGTNYREGKGLAVRRDLPLWSAAQAKEGSLKEDVVEPRQISEATVRIWSDSDVILGLCQTDKEAKEVPMHMRWYLGKNKNKEAKKIIPIIFDNFTMTMEEEPLSLSGTENVD